LTAEIRPGSKETTAYSYTDRHITAVGKIWVEGGEGRERKGIKERRNRDSRDCAQCVLYGSKPWLQTELFVSWN